LIEERGARYVGIDLRENRGGSVEILAGVGSLPLPAGELDVVLCTEVLDHVADLDGALREMGRTLKAGGSIVLTIPFCYPLHEEPEDYARWTPYRLRAAASACGLLVSDLTLFGNELEVIATVWANVWCRSRAAGRWPAVDRFVLPLLYVPFHLLCWAGSVGFGRRLPGKIFLGFGATLTRGSGPPGPA
jgi:SAM-dependent methyltransferase